MVFIKPLSVYITQGTPIKIPLGCKKLNHEVEVGVIIGKPGFQITESNAMKHIGGYTVSLDMTAADMLAEARQKGLPWTIGKGFDTACPVGDFIPKDRIENIKDLGLWLKINGEMKQDGNTKDMVFDVPKLISFMSQYITLEEGDLILTGSPAGVGPVKPGDIITCGMHVPGVAEVTFKVE
ncbi:oxaloacetate decarboxylase, mitochondrial-like [Saccoglossus kowalevskii]